MYIASVPLCGMVSAPAITPRPSPPTALGIMKPCSSTPRSSAIAPSDHRQGQSELMDPRAPSIPPAADSRPSITAVARQCTMHRPDRADGHPVEPGGRDASCSHAADLYTRKTLRYNITLHENFVRSCPGRVPAHSPLARWIPPCPTPRPRPLRTPPARIVEPAALRRRLWCSRWSSSAGSPG